MLSPRLMLFFAQTFLFFGGLSMIVAAGRLFLRATDAGMPSWNIFWIVPLAALLGASEAIFVMSKRMRQNVARLRATQGKLWIWQIYPVPLLGFIFAMVTLMFVLKRVLTDDPIGLAVLGGIDVTVAVALLVSTREYRRKES